MNLYGIQVQYFISHFSRNVHVLFASYKSEAFAPHLRGSRKFSQIFQSEQALVAVKIIALLHAMILRNNFDGRNHCDNHCAFAVMRYSDLVQRFSIRAHEVTLFSGNSFNSIWRINNSNSNFLLLRTQWFSETQWFCPSKSLHSVISQIASKSMKPHRSCFLRPKFGF